MVGPAADLLQNPVGAVRSLFTKSAGSDLSTSDWGVKAVFDKFLYQDGGISQVPQINNVPPQCIAPNSLVRFRGMVQDMLDVEYYIGAFRDAGVWRTNKYTDVPIPESVEQMETQIWDRKLLFCVNVPGENQWVSTRPSSVSAEASRTLKRQHGDTETMECDGEVEEHNKRLKLSDEDDKKTVPELGASALSSCIIKMYDGSDEELKLNDIAEFVGVFTIDPVIGTEVPPSVASDPLVDSFMEDDSAFQLSNAAMVPRLHCITVKKLSAYSVPRELSSASSFNALMRESLVSKLQTVIGEDRLAAEYLLLHLMSKVHSRAESMGVGKLSLNFSGCRPGADGSLSPFSAAVGQAISMLLPCSRLLPLSLGNLNSKSLAPTKDYATNRLVTGALQLARGTHLLLDETALTAGRLNETGMKNLQRLKGLLETQKVEYDFHYYQMQMPADLPVLVVSCGKSRLLPADVLVPLRCATDAVQMQADEVELWNWRTYLSSVREAEHVIEPSMQKILEDDLVSARQKDRTIGPETFHRWLTMARLLSLSFGERALSLERWEMMKALETECAARLCT